MTPTTPLSLSARPRKASAQQVLQSLEELCARSAPGDRIPTRTELMRLFDASERAVMSALEELRRSGRIVLRNGAGTFVAEPKSVTASHAEKTIVAVASPDHSFYDRALELLLTQSEGAGLSLVCRPFDPRKGSVPFVEEAAGYLLFGRALAPLATQLQTEGKRIVLVATPAAEEVFQVPNVQGDQQKGGYLVARHLIELGHRHLAIMSNKSFEMNSPRGLGIQRAIREGKKVGNALEISFITNEQFQDWKQNVEEARRYWARPHAPTAVAVWNDHDSLLFMSFLAYIGVRIPEQVSVVGYDNLPISQQCHPPLTTVDGALEAQLQAALDLLTQEQAPNPHQSVVVLPTLICRDSSAPLPSLGQNA